MDRILTPDCAALCFFFFFLLGEKIKPDGGGRERERQREREGETGEAKGEVIFMFNR